MLIRHPTAYISSCWQVVLVYLHPFRHISLLKCALQPKKQIEKKHYKPLFWEFKVVQGHRCWYH